MARKKKPFLPYYRNGPHVRRREAEERRAREEAEPTWEEKQEARARQTRAERDERMMARLEPERYIRRVEERVYSGVYLGIARQMLERRKSNYNPLDLSE